MLREPERAHLDGDEKIVYAFCTPVASIDPSLSSRKYLYFNELSNTRFARKSRLLQDFAPRRQEFSRGEPVGEGVRNYGLAIYDFR